MSCFYSDHDPAQVLNHLLFRAVSSTVLVSCLSGPSGPVSDKRRSWPGGPVRRMPAPPPTAQTSSSVGHGVNCPGHLAPSCQLTAGAPNALARMVGLSAVFMLVTFVVFAGYGMFAASVRHHVFARPAMLRWLRRGFAGSLVALGVRLAVTDR